MKPAVALFTVVNGAPFRIVKSTPSMSGTNVVPEHVQNAMHFVSDKFANANLSMLVVDVSTATFINCRDCTGNKVTKLTIY